MEHAQTFFYLTFSLGAVVCVVAALWVAKCGKESRSDRWAGIVALALSANWCVASASFSATEPIVPLTQTAAHLSWLIVLYRMFANDGRDESLQVTRPMIATLLAVEFLQVVLLTIGYVARPSDVIQALVAETSFGFRMLVSIGALVLLHNVYVGAARSSRRLLRWNAAALAGFWAFTLHLNTVGYLAGSFPGELVILQGLAMAIVAVPYAWGFSTQSADLRFQPSRTVTFRLLSLILIGGYLGLMLGVTQWLSIFDAGGPRLTQVILVIAASVLALIWLPSDRLRGWLRVTAVKHLFEHRYDYRAEWLRFTATIGRPTLENQNLHERAIIAMADICDSTAGILLLTDPDGGWIEGANWRWPDLTAPHDPISKDLFQAFEKDGLILDLDRARAGIVRQGDGSQVPAWLLDEPKAWAAVPLRMFDRLIGVIVLARPSTERHLDWEDFDLLGIVSQQLASYLSEHASQEALMETSQFDEFNRRMAFVIHDVKNLSSQMTLLLKNAERHVDKPEFRQDMLVTLRNSADKLNTMLARLGRYGTATIEETTAFEMTSRIGHALEQEITGRKVILVRSEKVLVKGRPDAFEQAVAHIVQNAMEASDAGSPVFLEVYSDGLSGVVQIVDSGEGMDANFLRTGLFKPFVSSKDGGFGIGAFEARELIRGMGGRLDVESRIGLGSRFTITLPLNSVANIHDATRQSEARQVA